MDGGYINVFVGGKDIYVLLPFSREMFTEIIFLTLVIELVTIVGRVHNGSMRDLFFYYEIPAAFHVHHAYIGLLLFIVYIMTGFDILLLIGLPLLFSDLIHHLIVLPLWFGRTEFP